MTRSAFIFGLLTCFIQAFVSAQPDKNTFEGNLNFNVTFAGGEEEDRAQVTKMVPESYKIYIKGNQTKVNMRGGLIGMMMVVGCGTQESAVDHFSSEMAITL